VYLEMIPAVRANPVAMGAIGLRSGASIVVWMYTITNMSESNISIRMAWLAENSSPTLVTPKSTTGHVLLAEES